MEVTFYAHVELSALSVVQFYKIDLNILRELSSEIKIANYSKKGIYYLFLCKYFFDVIK